MAPLNRRALLAGFAGLPALLHAPGAHALPPRTLAFPRDHGAHPDLRTEWWYVTGQAQSGGRDFGFQVTFFRTRVDATRGMGSRFAAKQLVFAHAALTDVQGKKLWHDQRIARAGFDVAGAAEDDARIKLRDWSLERGADGSFQARLRAADFALDLVCKPTQPVLLQGDKGLSRKGPEAAQASYYYSQPQLAVSGRIELRGQRFDTTAGKAWMDHEWSDDLLHQEAMGWDWIGMNLDDGSALTAFQLRRADGTPLWDGGSFRAGSGATYIAGKGETQFAARRYWTSPLSGAKYPVEWLVRTPADFYRVCAVLDNQELDSRASTGAIYWEGLSDLIDGNGRKVGRGYLEMTGYTKRLKL